MASRPNYGAEKRHKEINKQKKREEKEEKKRLRREEAAALGGGDAGLDPAGEELDGDEDGDDEAAG
jgi:hypothetical protein